MFWSNSKVVCLLLLLGGCATTSAGSSVPSWAIHLQPPTVRLDATLEALEPALIEELAIGRPDPRDTSPEQLALLAVRELSQGHPRDAAVLLSLASYRRFEQSIHVATVGMEQMESSQRGQGAIDVSNPAFKEYVRLEVRTVAAARFDGELERAAASLAESLEEGSARDDVMRVVMGNLHDEHAANEALKQRAQESEQPRPEQLAHPALAAAVRRYLSYQASAAAGGPLHVLASSAVGYLARVPLQSFRFAALRYATEPFHGLAMRAGLRLHQRDPELVAGELRSEQPYTRALTAMILGLAEDLPRIDAIERALTLELDPFARLSMVFALVRLGETQHLSALHDALRSTQPKLVEHALVLIHWLPVDLEARLPEQLLRDVMSGADSTPLTAIIGCALMRDLGSRHTLSDASLAVLPRAAASVAAQPPDLSSFSQAFAGIPQLDRGKVLAALRSAQAPVEPWLTRFKVLAQESDLPLLDQLLQSPAMAGAKPLVVAAAAAVPGAAAQALLERWYREQSSLRTVIAVQLVLRTDVDKRRLRALAHATPAVQNTIFALALGDDTLEQELPTYLASEHAADRYAATLAIKLFGSARHAELLRKNVAYHDDRAYPGDLDVRQLTLSALLDLALNQRRPDSVAVQSGAHGVSAHVDARAAAPLELDVQRDIYLEQMHKFFVYRWTQPKNLRNPEELTAVAAIKVGDAGELLGWRLERRSGEPSFDASVMASLQALMQEGASLPRGSQAATVGVFGRVVRIGFTGKQPGS